MPEFLTSMIGILGVLLGAGLQYWLSRSSENRKYQQMLRTQAYVDYLRALAVNATASKSADKHKAAESFELAADAKARIAIYGTKPIVEILAKFCEEGEKLDNSERKKTFVQMCQIMRSESLPHSEIVASNDVSRLLFH